MSVFYHGTRRGFGRGGVVFPRALHRGEGSMAPTNRPSPADASRWVFMTTELDLAWAYAWAAPGRGKPKVLVIVPHGTCEADPEHSEAMSAWRCEWATVSRVLIEPTITEKEARGGWKTHP